MSQTPDHYKQGKHECIQVMSELGLDNNFYLGNAFKYLWRCLVHKDGTVSNVKKAKHYLEIWLAKNNEEKSNG